MSDFYESRFENFGRGFLLSLLGILGCEYGLSFFEESSFFIYMNNGVEIFKIEKSLFDGFLWVG